MVSKPCFSSFSTQNHTESFINSVKIQFLDPKRAKLDQNSDFGHVRTYSWLHKLRNTQGKIYGTYLGNIYIYGVYKEYIRNIHDYLWYKIIRNTDPMGRPPQWGAAEGGACVSDDFISYIFKDIPYIFLYILHIYIYIFPKYVPYMFPYVFLTLWIQQKTGPYRKPDLYRTF